MGSEREKFEAWFKTTKQGKALYEYIIIHEPNIKTVFCKSGKKYRNAVVDASWQAWQAAKAQAVPDGYCIVPKEPTPKMIDATWDYDGEIQEMSHNTRNEFIYKAMIEAQEKENGC